MKRVNYVKGANYMKRKVLSLLLCLGMMFISMGTSFAMEGSDEAYVFSDGRGTDFILVDSAYAPVENVAEAVGAAVYSCDLTESSYEIPDEVTDPQTGNIWPVTALYDNALKESSYESIKIPDSVKSIGQRAFYGCKELTSITIPDGVQIIGQEAFAFCTGLKTITFSGKPEIAGNAFDGVKATAYYPLSWTEEPSSDACGGEIRWVLKIPAVSGLKAASAGYASAKISWKKLSGVDGYIVYRKNGDGWKRLAVITGTSYTDKNLVCGKTYTYTVRACRMVNGEEVKGAYDKKGVSATVVPGTVRLGEAKAGGNSITITWSKVSGASGYYVYRKVPSGDWKRIAEVGNSVTSYTDGKLSAGQYIYTLRAYRTVNGSNIRGGYDRNGISAYITPGVPKLTGASGSAKNITVKWSEIPGAQGYRIYRRSSTSDDWKRLSDISGGGTTSWKDTTAVCGTCYYTVRAYIKADGKNVWGGYQKPGLRVVISDTPVLVSAASSRSGGESRITVKWNAVPNADGYRVYRKIDNGQWKLYTTKSADTLSITDNKVSSGIVYTYTVRAYVKCGDGQVFSDYDRSGVKAVGYMEAPEIELGVDWYDDVYADLWVVWSEVENADGYIIYIKEAGDSSWERLEKITAEEALVDDGICLEIFEEAELGDTEYLITIRAYKTVDGKEVKGAYNKNGVSTRDAIDLSEDYE
ncbi:MAG: leucine-rich repeat protein [Lachnospiraceae bacterium]|nr:leucine-rich repeat protein [Lachnospiraceae bacterium]